MGANKYENFECSVVKRSSIHGADYNPRTITENALKKIKKWFKTEGRGQLAPITVNKNTMTVVSGHQRLTVLDQLNKYPEKGDYELTVALADLDDKTEVEANVFMNNRSAMGDFDFELLSELKDMYPDISIIDDFGFDESEIPLLFGELPDMGGNDVLSAEMGDSAEALQLQEQARKFSAEDFQRKRMKERHDTAEANTEHGQIYRMDKDDYVFTVVCVSNEEKRALMRLMHERETEKFIKASKLYDIYDHKIKLRELS